MLEMFRRIYESFISPPEVPKGENPLRFGVLGASDIAPMSLILPAKTHPEVVIACVAARDRARAEKYAKKHGIEGVHDTYQDCIYIPLPNPYHYEWAIRAIKAGKHVLLEKPCTSNGPEARRLFESPAVTAPNAPVLLEAFHYTFHPMWQTFMHLIHHDPLAGPVKSAASYFYIPRGYFGKDDIRFRGMLGDSRPVVENVEFRRISKSDHRDKEAEDLEQIDEAVTATFRSKTGAVGRLDADLCLASSFLGVKMPRMGWPKCVAELKEKDRETTVVESWTKKNTIKAYDWLDESDGRPGGASWSTYRYQLEEFVNRVRGRKGTGVWVEHQSSMDQMAVLDEMYEKGGLKVRPSREIDLVD
ncbi:dimeric dihydrodiol dehydrogenase [Talaromyces pinophilus]|uniref:D-xylose 1-dehydrogenase (NADP(+), D-xylono-1,5-lactone-forming) n=1 Tax=Talaromyces pinophilus TaxID=128442 RepID=A0A6V8H315_TALPI|nr:dimeric dihydrodiol dehydrogenase [Talaromyces pinophilus]